MCFVIGWSGYHICSQYILNTNAHVLYKTLVIWRLTCFLKTPHGETRWIGTSAILSSIQWCHIQGGNFRIWHTMSIFHYYLVLSLSFVEDVTVWFGSHLRAQFGGLIALSCGIFLTVKTFKAHMDLPVFRDQCYLVSEHLTSCGGTIGMIYVENCWINHYIWTPWCGDTQYLYYFWRHRLLFMHWHLLYLWY